MKNMIIRALILKGWEPTIPDCTNVYEKNGAVVMVTDTEITIYPAGEWIPEQYSLDDFKATPDLSKFYIPRQKLYVEFE